MVEDKIEQTNVSTLTSSQEFCRQVLQLDDTTSEDDLDERLRSIAESLKLIKDVTLFVSRLNGSQENVRSPSTESQTTSAASLWSRDRHSFQSSNTIAEESSRTSFSSSVTSTSDLPKRYSLSDSLSISRSPFRLIRGLNALRLSRASEREGCHHCPKDTASQRRALHQLPCGHRVCTQALRGMVLSAPESSQSPQCCQQTIPDRLIRHVHGGETYLSTSQTIHSTLQVRRSSRSMSLQSKVDSLIPLSEGENDRVLASTTYRDLRAEQDAQMKRFEDWSARREAQMSTHPADMSILRQKHAVDVTNLINQHTTAMNEAEDKQVQAEAALRDLQDREKQDNATALRHIEAFCEGKLASGEAHNRVVTEQDLAALKTAQDSREVLELKHTNAINVLRGEQEVRIKVRMQRQDREVAALEARLRKEELLLDSQQCKERQNLNDEIVQRRQRLYARWDLEIAICCKKLVGDNDEYDTTSMTRASAQMTGTG